jgi:hypothetical protein
MDRGLRYAGRSIDVAAPEIRPILPVVGEHCRAVKNCVRPEIIQRLPQSRGVADIDSLWGVTRLLGVFQQIDAGHLPAIRQQPVFEETPKKSSRSGDESPHS